MQGSPMTLSEMFASSVLNDPHVRPGTMAAGHVNLHSGHKPIDVRAVTTVLVVYVDGTPVDILYHQVSAGFELPAGRPKSIPFVQPVPWETPFTQLNGITLPEVTVGLRTKVTATSDTRSPGDLMPLAIHPTSGQWRLLEAARRLGWQVNGGAVTAAHMPGIRQSDPFLQRLELHSPHHSYVLQVAFVANPVGVDVLIDDGRARRLQLAVSHAHHGPDPAEVINDWLDERQRTGTSSPAH
jgi:sporulation-control protein